MDIISVPGRLVRDPVTRRVVDQTPIAIDPTDPSWSRLLKDGDVVEAPEDHVAPSPAATPEHHQSDAELDGTEPIDAPIAAHEAAAELQEHTA